MEELFLSSLYLTESIRKKIQKIIQKIQNETELQAVALVSREGMRLACAETATIDADENSASVAAMLSIAQDTCKRMNEGRLIQVVVRGELGYTVMTRVSPETVLVAMSSSQFNLGLYLRKLINYAYKIAEIIEGAEEKPVPVVESTTPPSPSLQKTVQQNPQSAPQPQSQQEEILFAKDIIEEPTAEEKPPIIQTSQAIPTPIKELPHPKPNMEIPKSTPSSETSVPAHIAPPTPVTPSPKPAPVPSPVPQARQEKKLQVDEEERKAILEALRIIGMIGKSENNKKR